MAGLIRPPRLVPKIANIVLYKGSTDGGVGFTEPPQNLSNNSRDSAFPAITVSGNNVYMVWHDTTHRNFEILYRPSNDNGIIFDPIISNLDTNEIQVLDCPEIGVS
jgi:hypothetical protein